MKQLTRSEYRNQTLSNLDGLTNIDRDNYDHLEQPVIVYKLILCFGYKIKVLEYRTESERDNKYHELKSMLKRAA